MRFKKGTKVEVLDLEEGPSGSWRCAEIIGINSRRYTVRYEGDIELLGKSKVERVSRKAIRPCPPPVDVLQDWVAGDVVEVLHNFSWKMATMLKVSRRDHILVRLVGSAVELKANKYDVRARICWQNGEWIVIGKASSKCDDLKFKFPSSRNDSYQPRNMVTFVSGRNNDDIEFTRQANIVPVSQMRPLKRRLYHVHSQVETYARQNEKKARLGNNENFWDQFSAMQQPEKVENVASSREVLHEKYTHPSLIDKIYGSSKMTLEREKKGGVGYSRSVGLKSNDDGSVLSSVASCSVYRNPSHELHHVFGRGQYEDNDSQSSDAESFCQLRPKEGNPIDEIRRLELHAYRCTIGALYASGSLSWEQELLLTNLRDSLHISNDEHLAEIRNLVSSSICIPSS